MQFSTLLFSLLISTVVAKDSNKTKVQVQSDEKTCEKMLNLEALVKLASNQTKVDQVTHGNATKASELEAQASQASTELTTLQSNATLMSTCGVIDAQMMEEDDCQETFVLQRFVKFAANETAVATITKNNATKAAEIQLQASNAASKLQTLQSNSTLQSACPAVMQKDECNIAKGLAKFVSNANNQTKLDKMTKGNATKEAEIKNQAAKAQTSLDMMESNTTFMTACDNLGIQITKEGEQATDGGISSAGVNGAGVVFAKMSSVTLGVVAVGMMML